MTDPLFLWWDIWALIQLLISKLPTQVDVLIKLTNSNLHTCIYKVYTLYIHIKYIHIMYMYVVILKLNIYNLIIPKDQKHKT